MAERRICVVTGTRADYGLLYWLMRELRDDPATVLQVVACGMHLSPEFGLTYRTIESDGFEIDAQVEMILSSDTPTGIAKSVGLGCIGFADAFARLRPDIVVVLGDRFEILAAAQAALFARIPVAHIHGGEVTEGAVDEAIRHAVTKMAHLHFAAAEPYGRRIRQLGEDPQRVFVVGAPGLDNLSLLDLPPRETLEQELGVALASPSFLVTYHPATLGSRSPTEGMAALLAALDAYPQATSVVTWPNADAHGRALIGMIEQYAAARPGRVVAVTSLGQRRYLGLMRSVDAVIGNSSSGIIEAPSLGTPTVNIGDRQRGRLRAASVVDCEETAEAIATAIATVLTPDFRAAARKVVNPYGDGGASPRIATILKSVDLGGLAMKSFHDLG